MGMSNILGLGQALKRWLVRGSQAKTEFCNAMHASKSRDSGRPIPTYNLVIDCYFQLFCYESNLS
jgi:hypothetical protein